MASVFKRNGAGPYVIQWFDHEGRRREKSTRTTDLRAAERIAAKLEADAALRREGVVDARQDRFAQQNRRPLAEHLADYLEDCRHVGQAPKHVVESERLLNRLVAQSGGTRLSDLTVETVQGHLRALRSAGLSARSVNIVRSTTIAFAGWCAKSGRLDGNPLKVLPRLDEQRDRRKIRRALTDEELARLLAVAEAKGRMPWYLTAVLAGLRRSELGKLTWGDVDLQAATLTVRDGKAHRVDTLPLHPQLASELRRLRPALALPSARVFPTSVSDLTRRRDFKAAGIAYLDESGRVADLHSLRTTLGTALARQGVAPQVAQRLMRHAKYDLTMRHYTALGLVDTATALNKLPAIGAPRDAAQASGTDGALSSPAAVRPADPQQIPQHSARESPPEPATPCVTRTSDRAPRARPNSAPAAILRNPTRGDAKPRDGEGEGTRTLDFQRDRLAL